jgi:predicted nucleotidyltransferase
MRSVRLKIDDRIYDNLLWLLKQFRKEELEILIEDEEFQENKKYLEAELKDISEGMAEFYTLEEVEEKLEKRIKKHEDRL